MLLINAAEAEQEVATYLGQEDRTTDVAIADALQTAIEMEYAEIPTHYMPYLKAFCALYPELCVLEPWVWRGIAMEAFIVIAEREGFKIEATSWGVR